MKRISKVFLIIILSVSAIIGTLWATGLNPDLKELKEGDIIFHASDSRQAPMLRYATASPITHCGIIIEKGGSLFVLEAEGTVQLTPVKKFISRGIGGSYLVRRSRKELPGRIKYKQYLGKKYDIAFKFDNGKFYCSELVYDIYKSQFGVELCSPRPLKDYHTLGIEKEAKRRGMKMDQLMVAPVDILNSDELKTIR